MSYWKALLVTFAMVSYVVLLGAGAAATNPGRDLVNDVLIIATCDGEEDYVRFMVRQHISFETHIATDVLAGRSTKADLDTEQFHINEVRRLAAQQLKYDVCQRHVITEFLTGWQRYLDEAYEALPPPSGGLSLYTNLNKSKTASLREAVAHAKQVADLPEDEPEQEEQSEEGGKPQRGGRQPLLERNARNPQPEEDDGNELPPFRAETLPERSAHPTEERGHAQEDGRADEAGHRPILEFLEFLVSEFSVPFREQPPHRRTSSIEIDDLGHSSLPIAVPMQHL